MGETAQAWPGILCDLDAEPYAGAAIGLIALASDVAIAAEVEAFIGGAGQLYTTRIPFERVLTAESLKRMEGHIEDAARLLLPGKRLDAVAFGCTSGSIAIGAAAIAAHVRKARPEVAVVNPMSAAVAGMKALGLRRVAVLAPYPDAVNATIAEFVEANGLEVAARVALRSSEDAGIGRAPPNRLNPESVADAARRTGFGDCDGLFISCTGLRLSGVLADIEAAIGKPVISSNQAMAWQCLRQAGIKTGGIGRLFDV